MSAWMIRAGRAGVYAEQWIESCIIGISWNLGGLDIAQATRNQIRDAYENTHPAENTGRIAAAVGQIARFAHDMVAGQRIVMYDPATRLYHIGKITGPCVAVEDDDLSYSRTVVWQKTACRDALAPSSRHSLGSISTIFTISDTVMTDLEQAADGAKGTDESTESETPLTAEDETSYSGPDDGIEAIKDRIGQISWEDMEQLVAGLLRAMGYHADVTVRGPDGGRDVVASHDALGLDGSRIVAEVKHRKESMGAPAVRSFIAGLHGDERGLYVSTGGFTKDARIEAMHSSRPIQLIDLDAFVRLYIDVYSRVDDETRAILPLTCIWCPAIR